MHEPSVISSISINGKGTCLARRQDIPEPVPQSQRDATGRLRTTGRPKVQTQHSIYLGRLLPAVARPPLHLHIQRTARCWLSASCPAAEMGACATKPGDLKVKGEAPLVLDDAAEKKAGVAETDQAADGSRRRSLSDLLKENTDSDVESPEEAEKKPEPATATVTAADEAGAATEEQITVEPSIATTEQGHAAEERGAKASQDPQTHEQVVEEEKRVDPDSVQVAPVPAQSVSEVVADASV